MKKQDNISISAIAEECGVSAMTVSRVLRNKGSVSEATRGKVIKVAERFGYIRSLRAGEALKATGGDKKRVEVIAGIQGRSMSIFHARLLTAIEQQLSTAGYDCIIKTCNGEYEQFLQLQENIQTSQADATILVGSFIPEHLKNLLEPRPDALLLDNPGDAIIEAPYESFSFDNTEAARIGIRHLLDTGRKKILLLSGFADHFFSKEITQGYQDAHSSRNIEIDENLILNSDFTPEGACKTVTEALNRKLKFDAVFTNDEMASGVYRALLQTGLMIPEDIAVCGCDGLPMGIHLFPRLTTVVLDYEELAARAVHHLLHERKRNRSVCRVRLLPRLLVRESTVKR